MILYAFIVTDFKLIISYVMTNRIIDRPGDGSFAILTLFEWGAILYLCFDIQVSECDKNMAIGMKEQKWSNMTSSFALSNKMLAVVILLGKYIAYTVAYATTVVRHLINPLSRMVLKLYLMITYLATCPTSALLPKWVQFRCIGWARWNYEFLLVNKN